MSYDPLGLHPTFVGDGDDSTRTHRPQAPTPHTLKPTDAAFLLTVGSFLLTVELLPDRGVPNSCQTFACKLRQCSILHALQDEKQVKVGDAAFLLAVGSFLLTVELFLLTVDNFSFFTYSWSFFAYSFSFLTYSWSIFAYSGKVRLIRALRDCKQRFLTVSKKAPTVSKKASPINTFWGARHIRPASQC